MKAQGKKTRLTDQNPGSDEKNNLQEYPLYPASEDIYNKYKKEKNINPEDITKSKEPFKKAKAGTPNEIDFDDDMSGNDLDIPGSELDDSQEDIGSEDEENNYYSLGGDEHNDLEENNAE